MSYIKKCLTCVTMLTDTANNKRKYCPNCVLARIKQSQQIYKDNKASQHGPHKLQCLVCNKFFYKPMAHVWQKHGMSSKEYKDYYNLENTGIYHEDRKQTLRQHVKDNYHVVENNLLKKGIYTRFKGGKAWFHNYIRKAPTLARLRLHIKNITQK